MKKLTLKLDDLRIESFQTIRGKTSDAGSVEAYQVPTAYAIGSCFEVTCRPELCRTNLETCGGGECGYSWDGDTCDC
ncbi:MAG TPA: hypothetical protein VFR81_13200 [Longimicrobium sp.]|nr:hypothetical protein [Longimicrobium sp.]